jgi:(2Fe-2S) ferredoxin
MAARERYIQVCTNQMPADHPLGCCHDRGAQANLRKLKEELQARGLGDRIRVSTSGCFARCENGPNMVVYPDAVWYGRVTPEDVVEIIEEHLIGGRPVERLRLKDSGDFI